MVFNMRMSKRDVSIVAICFAVGVILCFHLPRHFYNVSNVGVLSFVKSFTTRSSGSRNITIGVLVTDKKGTAEFTASTIRKFHNINDEEIYVGLSTEDSYNEAQITNWYGKNVNIIAGKSTEMSLRNMLQSFINNEDKILFLIDSSTVFLPSWKDFITQHMIEENATFLSLYHSSYMHDPEKDCQKYVGDLCEGPLAQKLGVAISHELAEKLLSQHANLLGKYDWNNILKKENIRALYPKNSLLIDIDQTNQDDIFCGETDVPYEFQLCDLPSWVRDGVEFYFDRCTDPQEQYTPGLAADDPKLKDRMWTKPVISFSLYGGKTRYTNGAITNAKRVFSIYPGWKIWMYLDNSVPKNIMTQLCSKSIRFINVTGTPVTNQMSWRFLVAAEPVKMYHILDIDYRILTRGKEAVDDWIKSGRKFHVMRDHPNHSRYSMSGGMWGGLGKSVPNIKELLLKYRGNNNYMTDMNFLNGVLWPIVKENVWAHDSHSIHKFGEDHPFPTESKNGEFVGNVDFS